MKVKFNTWIVFGSLGITPDGPSMTRRTLGFAFLLEAKSYYFDIGRVDWDCGADSAVLYAHEARSCKSTASLRRWSRT